MPLILAITDSDELGGSLCRYFSATRGLDVAVRRRGLLGAPDGGSPPATEVFSDLAEWIEQQAVASGRGSDASNLIVFVELPWLGDGPSSHNWNPIGPHTVQPWARVVAMLVLAFPEAHWVLITPFRSLAEIPTIAGIRGSAVALPSPHVLATAGDLPQILHWSAAGFTPLFDPTAFRQRIRDNVRAFREGESQEAVADYVPRRIKTSVAIDDEQAYAYFSSYAAYRHGYRAHTVMTLAMMRTVFGEERTDAEPIAHGEVTCSCPVAEGTGRDGIALTLEDVYLAFPDHDWRLHLSSLCDRDRCFPVLQNVPRRIFVTSGHDQSSPDADTARAQRSRNNDHLTRLPKRGSQTKRLLKPYSGLFALWRDAKLYDFVRRSNRLQLLIRAPWDSPDVWNPNPDPGLAPGYVWPPHRAERATAHSSPGKLAVIARHLLDRARRHQSQVSSVQDAVLGATLALEAEEYLGHRSPTTALEALVLRHRFEVLAECMFHGVSEDLGVAERFTEIDRHLHSIGYWFGEEKRQRAVLSAKSSISAKLVLVFRDHYRFDQELMCLAHARTAATQLRKTRNPLRWVPYLSSRYATLVLNNPWHLVLAVTIWFVVLTGAFAWVVPGDAEHSWWSRGALHALTSFVGLSPSESVDVDKLLDNGWFGIWFAIAVALGVIHLGLFVSHLYALAARR